MATVNYLGWIRKVCRHSVGLGRRNLSSPDECSTFLQLKLKLKWSNSYGMHKLVMICLLLTENWCFLQKYPYSDHLFVCSSNPRPVSGAVEAQRLWGDKVHGPWCLPSSSDFLGDWTTYIRAATPHPQGGQQDGPVHGQQPLAEAEGTTGPHLHL